MTRVLTIGLLIASFSLLGAAQNLANRQVNQRQRIQQGVQSGQLTRPEAARLRADERQLHRNVVRDRATGGGISPREHAQLERQANHDSRQIARLKHNNRTR